MQIKLKSLTLTNFKGIQHFTATFNHITNFLGDNATGKTTLFDAFLWLFFGKNSEDASKFEVKRLDANNQFIKDLEAEVSSIVHVDGQEICIKKVLRQKWTKRRGSPMAEYAGDENVYFWNDVPLKESEFKAKVAAIIDEKLFKLITNPFYFNTLSWQDRRNILINIAGNISNEEVFDSLVTPSNKQQFSALITALNQRKTIEEFQRELAVKKKKIKDEAESIPSRIDEVKRGMPEQRNWDLIHATLHELNQKVNEIAASLTSQSALQKTENEKRLAEMLAYNNNVRAKQRKIFDLKTQMQNIEFDARQRAKEASGKLDAEIRSYTLQLHDKKADRDRFAAKVESFKLQVAQLEAELEKLRDEVDSLYEKELTFDGQEFNCPTCKQKLPEHDIEATKTKLTENFNRDRLQKTENITRLGKEKKHELEILQTRIANGNKSIADLDYDISVLESKIEATKATAAKNTQPIDELTTELLAESELYRQLKIDLEEAEALTYTEPVFETSTSNTATEALKAEQRELQVKINALNREAMDKEVIEKAEARVKELSAQESKLAQDLTQLEGTEFVIMEFVKAKIDTLEKRINNKFSYVKFKMFDQQVNGGEKETCETLVNSNGAFVPFSDANNAARINAGIDIINALCNHYDVYAPIFIDNRESVTRLIDCESQIVNLIVSETDKKLRVA